MNGVQIRNINLHKRSGNSFVNQLFEAFGSGIEISHSHQDRRAFFPKLSADFETDASIRACDQGRLSFELHVLNNSVPETLVTS